MMINSSGFAPHGKPLQGTVRFLLLLSRYGRCTAASVLLHPVHQHLRSELTLPPLKMCPFIESRDCDELKLRECHGGDCSETMIAPMTSEVYKKKCIKRKRNTFGYAV